MNSQTRDAVFLSLFGALAGLAFYILAEIVPDVLGYSRLWFALCVFMFCLFGGALAMAGPVALLRSLIPAAGMAIAISVLTVWASLRFGNVNDFVKTEHPFAVILCLFVISLPFLMTSAGQGTSPRQYGDLFDAAWGAVTRVIVAMAFTGLFWGLLILSDSLLQLVGLTIIEDLLEIDFVPPILTGLVFGLAVAVVYELADLISPQLVLRLLRLLMPMITVVVAIFVVALPFRGLSNLFGSLSAGAVMIGMGVVAISLVSAAIDRAPQSGVQRIWMKVFVQLLACLVPILGALAIAAVWVRVQDYGWTPDRLGAATLAGITFVYGVAYAVCVLGRGNWGHRLRQANIALSLGVVSVLALWLTPVLNPQKISTTSQLARLDAGDDISKLPLYDLAHMWGFAGKAGLTRLKVSLSEQDDQPALALIKQAQDAENRYAYSQATQGQINAEKSAQLDDVLGVLPKGRIIPSDVFDGSDYNDKWVFDQCLPPSSQTPSSQTPTGQTPTGQPPECVLIYVEKDLAEREHLILLSALNQEWSGVSILTVKGDLRSRTWGDRIKLGDDAKADVRAGRYKIAPPSWQSVWIGGQEIIKAPWVLAE